MLLSTGRSVNVPKRAALRASARPAIQDIGGEVEVSSQLADWWPESQIHPRLAGFAECNSAIRQIANLRYVIADDAREHL
jgi:hypothetical protein